MSESYVPNAKTCGCPLWMECEHPQPAQAAPPVVEIKIPPAPEVPTARTLFVPLDLDTKLAKVERENAELRKKVEKVERKKRFNVTIDRSEKKSGSSSGGIGIGTVLAVFLSYSLHGSIVWAVIHGLFGWLYVFYYLLGGGQ